MGADHLAVYAAIGSRALSAHGHDDFNQGQISYRRPGAGEFSIKAAQLGFDEAGPDDFVLIPAPGSTIETPRSAPPETPLHEAIYQARPDVACIVHSHAPAGLIFGATDGDLGALSHEGALFRDNWARFTLTSNTVLDRRVADAIAHDLSDHIAVFLVNHGTVVVGKSVRHAVVFAMMLERACRLQLDAWATGREFSVSDDRDIEAKRAFIFADLSVRSYWEHTRRVVERATPAIREWSR